MVGKAHVSLRRLLIGRNSLLLTATSLKPYVRTSNVRLTNAAANSAPSSDTIAACTTTVPPQASNSTGFGQRKKEAIRPTVVRIIPPGSTKKSVAKHIMDAEGRLSIPTGSWIHVKNIPPLSSLEALLRGIQQALKTERERGILNLDATWNPDSGDLPPFLEEFPEEECVTKARMVLSPYGRPTGWYLKLRNRSVAYALLTYNHDSPILCASRRVTVSQWNGDDNSLPEMPAVSNATLRVENCPQETTPLKLINLFSRFDLRAKKGMPSVVKWRGQTADGRRPPNTYLVHFQDASWARAALREMQGASLQGNALRLIQFPRQIP